MVNKLLPQCEQIDTNCPIITPSYYFAVERRAESPNVHKYTLRCLSLSIKMMNLGTLWCCNDGVASVLGLVGVALT